MAQNIDSGMVLAAMRNASWQRAKGELLAMLRDLLTFKN